MKRKLFAKLMICYFIALLVSYIVLNTLGTNRLYTNLKNEKLDILYNEANLISSEYMAQYYNGTMSSSSLISQLKTIDTFVNARIWIVNRNGDINLDTRPYTAPNPGINLFDLDEDFLSNCFSHYTMLEGVTSKPMLSVVLPVTMSFQTKGYIVLLSSLEDLKASAVYYMDIFNLSFLIISIVIFLLLCFLFYMIARPVERLTKATREYASGHFDYKLKLKYHEEYKDLGDAIHYMADELNNLDDYQKKFVANISHDFRSPLTSIKGYAEALKDGTIPYDMKDKYLDIILFESERLTKLTSNLLVLNQFENKGTYLETSVFDINLIIKKTAESFEGICMKKKITLKLIFSEKSLFVEADMGKIQQVLYNLIDNAIKFSHANSSIKVQTYEKNEKVFVSVKDYGIGISKENIKKIWDRFYKIDSSRGKDKKGTGLGLSITKDIINAHKENINVISTEGVGTEFIFTLPKANGQP